MLDYAIFSFIAAMQTFGYPCNKISVTMLRELKLAEVHSKFEQWPYCNQVLEMTKMNGLLSKILVRGKCIGQEL